MTREKPWWRDKKYQWQVDTSFTEYDVEAIIQESTRLGRDSMAQEICKIVQEEIDSSNAEWESNIMAMLILRRIITHLKNEEK